MRPDNNEREQCCSSSETLPDFYRNLICEGGHSRGVFNENAQRCPAKGAELKQGRDRRIRWSKSYASCDLIKIKSAPQRISKNALTRHKANHAYLCQPQSVNK